MLKNIKMLSFVFIVLSMVSFCTVVQAQEEETLEFEAGIVQSVSESMISIVDPEIDPDLVIVFKITDSTVLENVTAVSEIVVGDEVYVDYQVQGEENLAVNIYKIGIMEYGEEENNMGEEKVDGPQE